MISLTLHVAAAMALAYASQVNAHHPLPQFRPARTTLVYVPIVPIVPVEIQTIKLVSLRTQEPVSAEEPAPLRPMPEVAPVFESRRAEVLEPVELPVEPAAFAVPASAPKPTTPTLPAPRKPEVAVGAFANAPAAPARIPEAARQIEIAGFDRSTKQTIEMKPATTAVGGFDRQATFGPPKGGPLQDIENVIADAGFNRSAVVMSTAPEGKIVREIGFGNTISREKPRTAEPAAEVASVTFDRARAPQQSHSDAAPPPAPQLTSVEVLSKPTPLYTDEARKLGIEGDVILEVEFCANGRIRILRVVRGLGYGLDESAVRAAQQIRFKPAQASSGKSVDSRATVNIVFRLA